jgi:hypothetical protein
VWLQAGPDQVHVAFSAHAATTRQPARGWVTFEGDIEGVGPLAAAGTVTAVFDHTVYGPPLGNGTELCVCGVMTSTTGPPPPPPPWPPPAPYGGDWVTAPDTDDDGTDNEFCMYVVDAGEPGSEGANDAAVVLHEGFPWSFWFPDPYQATSRCTTTSRKPVRTTGRLRRGRPVAVILRTRCCTRSGNACRPTGRYRQAAEDRSRLRRTGGRRCSGLE